MITDAIKAKMTGDRPDLGRAIAPFSRSDTRKAVWQLINTIIPYLGLMVLMTVSVVRGWHYFLTLWLAVHTVEFAFMILIFVHDFCLDSFFSSRRANRISAKLSTVSILASFMLGSRNETQHKKAATVGPFYAPISTPRWVPFACRFPVDTCLSFQPGPCLPWSTFSKILARLIRNPAILPPLTNVRMNNALTIAGKRPSIAVMLLSIGPRWSF